MVKNSKKSKETAVPGNGSSAPESAAPGPAAMAKSAKPTKATARPKSASKPAGKTPAPRKPRAATGVRKTRKIGRVAISDDDIRLRAYFISEKRRQNGLPGDSAHDWLEAHRQLLEEAGKSAL
jgi:hypothetical protein